MATRGFPDQKEEPLLASLRRGLESHDHVMQTLHLSPHLSDDDLEAHLGDALLPYTGGAAWVFGGFSLGARIAAQLVARVPSPHRPAGLLFLGFPFHHLRKPSEPLGFDHLFNIPQTHTLVIQGALDPYGSKLTLEKKHFPNEVEISWIDDANHRFESKTKDHLEQVSRRALEFVTFIEGQSF